mmetsp:Transcript_61067/g.108932  ORF Transcript_61067/g.108932 Transcript_61067/m.108932 type:complete len:360 (-) Transcript_61067:489-1568(-)
MNTCIQLPPEPPLHATPIFHQPTAQMLHPNAQSQPQLQTQHELQLHLGPQPQPQPQPLPWPLQQQQEQGTQTLPPNNFTPQPLLVVGPQQKLQSQHQITPTVVPQSSILSKAPQVSPRFQMETQLEPTTMGKKEAALSKCMPLFEAAVRQCADEVGAEHLKSAWQIFQQFHRDDWLDSLTFCSTLKPQAQSLVQNVVQACGMYWHVHGDAKESYLIVSKRPDLLTKTHHGPNKWEQSMDPADVPITPSLFTAPRTLSPARLPSYSATSWTGKTPGQMLDEVCNEDGWRIRRQEVLEQPSNTGVAAPRRFKATVEVEFRKLSGCTWHTAETPNWTTDKDEAIHRAKLRMLVEMGRWPALQ